MTGRRNSKREESLQIAVSRYLKAQYPGVIFTSESSGLRLTIGQAVKAKAMRSRDKLPDLIILQPQGGYSGLCLELKRSPDEIYTKDGKYRQTDHIQEQLTTLLKLEKLGYSASFACGIDECIRIIDEYMRL